MLFIPNHVLNHTEMLISFQQIPNNYIKQGQKVVHKNVSQGCHKIRKSGNKKAMQLLS